MNKTNVSILLVEDDKISRVLYGKFLTNITDNIFVAENGREGIAAFKKHRPDIIVSDIKMPEMDGIEMIREVRKLDDKVKIVLVSGHQETDYFIQSIKMGIAGYLLKPVDQKQFKKIISDLVNNILLDRKIKETEKKFRDLAELLPEIVFETDLNGDLVFINKRALEILGYEEGSEGEINIQDITIPASKEDPEISGIEIFLDNKYINEGLEIKVKARNGNTFPALIYATAITRDGKPTGIRGVMVNITARKVAENKLQSMNQELEDKVKERTKRLSNEVEERKLAQKSLNQRIEFIELINTTSSEFIRLDNTQIDDGISKALKDVVRFTDVDRGYVYQLAPDKNHFELSHEWARVAIKKASDHFQKLAFKEHKTYYERLIQGDHVLITGIEHPEDLLNNPFTANEDTPMIRSLIHLPMFIGNDFIGFYGFDTISASVELADDKVDAFQITGQIIANAIQRKKYDEELIKAKEKAEESDKSKSAFLANISHEIQTPIKAIISFSHLLQSPDLSEKRKKEFINIIDSNGQALLNLTNDILEFTRIQSNIIKLIQIPFELNLFLEELYTVFDSLKVKRGKESIDLKLKIPDKSKSCNIHSDPSRLKQIFTNLIGNAFKFTNEGTVEYGYEFVDQSTLLFHVTDTGIGISKKYQKLIFDRFIQEPKPHNIKKEGTGLGLAITQSLIKMLNGDIWVDSELGKGSSFYFKLPDIVVSGEDQEKDQKYQWENKTVLVVEKSIKDYIQLEEILMKHTKLMFAADGKQALEMCRTNTNIDLILFECSLTSKDGMELFEQFRNINDQLAIISICDPKSAEHAEKEQHSDSFDEHIHKPFEANMILDILDKYLS